jgi:hypothetical protein
MLHTRYLIAAGAALLVASCGGGEGGSSPPPAPSPPAAISAVQIVSGNNQTAPGGADVPSPLVGRVVDVSGNPLAGRTLNFIVKTGGGAMFVGSSTSDTSGQISDRWTLGSVAGAQSVEVRGSDGATGGTVYATFNATALAGPPSKVSGVTGDGQAQMQAQVLPVPLTITVTDAHGNISSGTTVNFVPCAACGSANPASAVTNGAGVASTTWTLGVPVGAQQLFARVSGNTLYTFSAASQQAPPGAPASVLAYLGNGQTVSQHAQNAQPFVVVVYDALGNVVPGAEVDFAPAPGSDFFTPVTATTLFNGGASFSTYFHSAGPQQVSASVPGVATAAIFDVTVTANTWERDGYYDCTITRGRAFYMTVTHDVVAAQEYKDPGHGLYGITPNPLTADGHFSGTFRVSLDYRRAIEGTVVVNPDDTASASGTSIEYFSTNPPAPGTPPDATWNCVRQ